MYVVVAVPLLPPPVPGTDGAPPNTQIYSGLHRWLAPWMLLQETLRRQ